MVIMHYTIYYGFKKFSHSSRFELCKAAKVAKVPLSNIVIGIRYVAGKQNTMPAWQPPNKACSRLLLLVGKIIRFCENRNSG